MTSRTKYALLGIALSIGSPAGMLLLKVLSKNRQLGRRLSSYIDELRDAPLMYGYLAVATAAAFAVFGQRLGAVADALRQTSTTDPLTGLHNARAFADRLHEAVVHASRYGEAVSVLLVDVDRLKTFNDTRGHAAGNAALQAVGDALRSSLRSADMGFRWGGDEFAVLAPHTTLDEATRIAERIVSAMSGHSAMGLDVSVSIGVAAVSPDRNDVTANVERAIQDADAALYRAKEEGRGCFRTSAGRYNAQPVSEA